MKNILHRIQGFEVSLWSIAGLLFVVAILSYGLFFWQLGFYWDDMPISWIRYQFGPQAMRLYFSTSRPVWGELYQITTRFLPHIPMFWQLLAIFWRWVTAVLCWAIIRELWPNRRQAALIVSCFFLLYPGFNEQSVSFIYSHFFIVLSAFLFSYLLMLWSYRHPQKYWLLTILALCFSTLNIWMMEYFFSLELIRPFIILCFLVEVMPVKSIHDILNLISATIKRWMPYLVVWLANVLYRTFVFSNLAYKNVLLTNLRLAPIQTIIALFKTVLSDLYLVSIQAWMQIFQFPTIGVDGPRTILFYIFVVLFSGLLLVIFLQRIPKLDHLIIDSRNAIWLIVLGLLAMITGGGPYWLANLELTLGFPANRFTLSFMLGASLFLAGLLEFIPARIRLFLAALLIALAAGRQALWVDTFRRDWTTHKDMFWQMIWRAPALKPNTIVLMNEGALNYYADNSIGAALNWIYDPDNHSSDIKYVFFYPSSRLGGALTDLRSGLPVKFTYLIGDFSGNTDQAVVFYYQPPGCLRLLDPEIDSTNRLIPDGSLMREAARLSSSEWILSQSTARMPEIYNPEPAHTWCYFFEKADLARQLGDWKQVVELGDKAFRLDDYPNDPLERFVFIEGYAHTKDWKKAVELSQASHKVSKNYLDPLLCKLWGRIARETESTPEQKATLDEVKSRFECIP